MHVLSISVFRFSIRSRTVAAKTAVAPLVQATSSMSLENQSERPAVLSPTLSASSMFSAYSVSSTVMRDNAEYHVFIVEDNIINQTVLKRQLIKAGILGEVGFFWGRKRLESRRLIMRL